MATPEEALANAAADWYPVWTPDGRRLAFGATRTGGNVPYWQPVDRPGAPEVLTTATNVGFPYGFTPDGRTLICGVPGGFATIDLSTPERAPVPLFKAGSAVRNPDLSRDGKWLAYESDETGRLEVFVRPFPDVEAGKWQVSTGGGAQPVWSRDGTELFFIDAGRMLSAARVRTAPTFSVSAIAPVLDMAPYFTNDRQGRPCDVSLDGKRSAASRSA